MYNIQVEIVFQKLQNLWVTKALMSSYILCKILSFLPRVAQKAFNRPGSYLLAELIINSYYELSIFRTDLFVVASETELLMLMRQIL